MLLCIISRCIKNTFSHFVPRAVAQLKKVAMLRFEELCLLTYPDTQDSTSHAPQRQSVGKILFQLMLILVYVLFRRGGNILLQTISTNPSKDSSLKSNNQFGLQTAVCSRFPIVCIGVVVKWWRKSVNHSIELLAIKFP